MFIKSHLLSSELILDEQHFKMRLEADKEAGH